ncbi:MAG TPA: hypothetical protein VFP00_02905, partial [Burkholderiales bacterium]|nr:hypothetical protein [Burkholderiales bacterium]
MHPLTVYTKTAKGVLETRSKTGKLTRELNRVFLMVDGKSTVAQIVTKDDDLEEDKLHEALAKLEAEGYIKIFSAPAEAAAFSPAAVDLEPTDELELDFTSPELVAKLNVEAAARAKTEAEA